MQHHGKEGAKPRKAKRRATESTLPLDGRTGSDGPGMPHGAHEHAASSRPDATGVPSEQSAGVNRPVEDHEWPTNGREGHGGGGGATRDAKLISAKKEAKRSGLDR